MNPDQMQHKLIRNKNQWQHLLHDDTVQIHSSNVISEDFLEVTYKNTDKHMMCGKKQSVVLAAFVTAYGRIHLWKEMKKLGDRVLYHDTDSIVFIDRPGCYKPSLGKYLGDFTDEINPKDGNHIVEFVSAGPKNYGYVLDTGKTTLHVKGFSMSYSAGLAVNFETMKEMVTTDRTRKTKVDQIVFTRDKNASVRTNKVEKLYGFTYTKRKLQEDLTTLPFGY